MGCGSLLALPSFPTNNDVSPSSPPSTSTVATAAALTTLANGNPLKLKLRNRRNDRTDESMSGEEEMDTKDAVLLALLLLLLG